MFTTRISAIERQRACRTGVTLTAGEYFAPLEATDANVATEMTEAFAKLYHIEREWLKRHPAYARREWHEAAAAMDADATIAATLQDARHEARQVVYEFLASGHN